MTPAGLPDRGRIDPALGGAVGGYTATKGMPMAQMFDQLDDTLIDWIGEQHVFFVATAPRTGGHVNVSPKGYDTLRVLGPNRIAYLDLTGSGAETVAHAADNGRITLMFCAFAGPPRIARLYGQAVAHPLGTPGFDDLAAHFDIEPGARAVVEIAISQVQTSCGYSVPLMEFQSARPTLRQWAGRRSDDELAAYRAETNAVSIDGLPALLPEPRDP